MEEHALILEIPSLNASAPRATVEVVAKKVGPLYSVCTVILIPTDAIASNSSAASHFSIEFLPVKFVGKIKLSKLNNGIGSHNS